MPNGHVRHEQHIERSGDLNACLPAAIRWRMKVYGANSSRQLDFVNPTGGSLSARLARNLFRTSKGVELYNCTVKRCANMSVVLLFYLLLLSTVAVVSFRAAVERFVFCTTTANVWEVKWGMVNLGVSPSPHRSFLRKALRQYWAKCLNVFKRNNVDRSQNRRTFGR